jgi:hypothetical protein
LGIGLIKTFNVIDGKLAMKEKNKILLLTLMHPVSLPPVYAIGQVLRDEGYVVDIISFENAKPDDFNPGAGITMHNLGRYHGQSDYSKWKLRNTFAVHAKKNVTAQTRAIISFCSFSYIKALKVANGLPVYHIALEVADYNIPRYLQSFLSTYNNYRTLKNLHKAVFVATPSYQRSAWFAGRAATKFMPHTIYNTSYLPAIPDGKNYRTIFESIVPGRLWGKKMILYTGNVTSALCIQELVEGVCATKDDCCLVITGMKDDEYCATITETVKRSPKWQDVLLLPYVTRDEMIALQTFAHIGALFVRERDDKIVSRMIAPNKAGEYLMKGLLLLGNDVFYMQQFSSAGVAVLSPDLARENMVLAISAALAKVDSSRDLIEQFVKDTFNMKVQFKPVLDLLNKA